MLTALIVLGTLASVWATLLRVRVEMRNRRVEIGVEWQEIVPLAQMQGVPPQSVLARFQAQRVNALVLYEETLGAMENLGAVRPRYAPRPSAPALTQLLVYDAALFDRIRTALTIRRIPFQTEPNANASQYATRFVLVEAGVEANLDLSATQTGRELWVTPAYSHLRSLGLGLPPDGIAAARQAGMRIVGRIGNFAGVTAQSAEAALRHLKEQGASFVLFTGDETLGYRGLETQVADLLRDPNAPPPQRDTSPLLPTGMTYGAVEFGKQKGDDRLSGALHGDYARVHSIQAAEMAQMSEVEAIDRFVRAVKERNIRFCYVRLWTQTGDDPIGANVEFLRKIARGMEKGNALTGGGLEFGEAKRFGETGVPKWLFGVIALNVAAGLVWLVTLAMPLPASRLVPLLGVAVVGCVGVAFLGGESGRRLAAFLAGVLFPAIACLTVFPGRNGGASRRHAIPVCIGRTLRSLGLATAITSLGVLTVTGLLATRPFMVRANQFFGIKPQHVLPLALVALVALIGGSPQARETWEAFRERILRQIRALWNEPARLGLLIIAGIVLVALFVMVARTGNDAGVGVSGLEMKFRAVLDRLLPTRPRTKEFLVGHPVFVLALALWWRGRRQWAIPLFVFGSLGQISLLNTFCHIHSPLVLSVWRGGIGLAFGTILGVTAFVGMETLFARWGSETISAPPRLKE